MLNTFFNNGIRFYPVNSNFDSIASNFDRLPYSEQLLLGLAQKTTPCAAYEYVNFTKESRFVLWSDADVTLSIYNASNSLLASEIKATDNWALDADTAYYFNINFSTIAGINTGSYIVATNGSEYLRSEPLTSPKNLFEIIFENKGDHAKLNTFQNCVFLNAYFPAKLLTFNVEQFDKVFATSANRSRRLAHGEKITRVINSFALPPYKADSLVRQFKSDILKLKIKPTLSDNIRLFEGNPVQVIQPERFHLAQINAKVVFDNSLTMRIPYQNAGSGNAPTILPETLITQTSVQINWTGAADTYDLQISTTPDFSAIVLNLTGLTSNSYNVTSLTSCTKYYYRLRGVSCSGISDWVINQTRHYLTCHFRGAYRATAIKFDEKITPNQTIVSNIFGMCSGVGFQYSNGSGEPSDWSAFTILNVSDLESQIEGGGDDYWVRVSITGYATQNLEGVVAINYQSASFYTQVGCVEFDLYTAGALTKDISTAILANNKFNINGINGAPSGAKFYYALFSNNAQDFTNYKYNTLADLNNAINSAPDNANYIISIYAALFPISKLSLNASFL